jgi:hypothetical protein
VIEYEDSEEPKIAIAPAEFDFPTAQVWVRSYGKLMMLRDLNRSWMLLFVARDNSVKAEAVPFRGVTDVHEAAKRMRRWLGNAGLLENNN